MINESPSENKHPQKSEQHPLEAEVSPEAPNRRVHPLEAAPVPTAAAPRQRIIVAFPPRRPTVTFALIVINTLIFMVGLIYPSQRAWVLEWGTVQRAAILENSEYYRLFTSMFLHGDIAHLFINMYALFIIGTAMEWLFGHARFLAIYLLGGLAGSVLFALRLDPRAYGLGASGALFAVWGAEIVYLYQHRNVLGAYARAQLQHILIFAVLNLVIGATNPGIGTWAHVGGLFGGAALAWWVSPTLIRGTHPNYPDAILLVGVKFGRSAVTACVLFSLLLVGILLAARSLTGM